MTHDLTWGHAVGVLYPNTQTQAAISQPVIPRPLVKHLRVRVIPISPTLQRIIVSDANPPRRASRYLTIQDAEYVIGQLQRAIKRAPRAR